MKQTATVSTPRRAAARDLARALLVERLDDSARVVDALGDLEAVAAADVRRRDVLVGVPEVVLRAARISITSRKPLVVTIAAGGSRRVIRALVATVVPCEKSERRLARSTFAAAIP
jgi:hypothetical protein